MLRYPSVPEPIATPRITRQNHARRTTGTTTAGASSIHVSVLSALGVHPVAWLRHQSEAGRNAGHGRIVTTTHAGACDGNGPSSRWTGARTPESCQLVFLPTSSPDVNGPATSSNRGWSRGRNRGSRGATASAGTAGEVERQGDAPPGRGRQAAPGVAADAQWPTPW